ncbi:MAG: hypothetical protein QMD46_06685 [Methanomicrobiales archaeon]|nr:hypothetical protein [Methanomicrobiales archaeon]MDI6876349.1 hypothetical protein [Methanomicrobiales archaeon]
MRKWRESQPLPHGWTGAEGAPLPERAAIAAAGPSVADRSPQFSAPVR